jgi:hypothetical protein
MLKTGIKGFGLVSPTSLNLEPNPAAGKIKCKGVVTGRLYHLGYLGI